MLKSGTNQQKQQQQQQQQKNSQSDITTKYGKEMSFLQQWKSRKEFAMAQVQVAIVLVIAYIGNNWPSSYPRNDNHNPTMFWVMNGGLFIAFLATLKHDKDASSRGVQLLSRPQTEEWKGWMQWAFIMYHYYRVFYVYNEIRVFVSAYVWMTGFGNFLYFEKKQDFSIERIVSMWLRINYFPLLLSLCLTVPLELYYVVPLHTVGFFITMTTCYIASLFKGLGFNYWRANGYAIAISLLVHVIFYETRCVDSLLFFSKEYHFRFQADKYSAWIGIFSAMFWGKFKEYMQYLHAPSPDGIPKSSQQKLAVWGQRASGVFLIWMWYYAFGYMSDKFMYNPVHPYIFWMPVAGWLLIRNSSKYLCELHSTALEFLGKITLETYVLQFHVFMSHNVQHIPILIPGAGADGSWAARTANMLLCGSIFVPLALLARKATVATQLSVTEFVTTFIWVQKVEEPTADEKEETEALTAAADAKEDGEGTERKSSKPKTEAV